MADFGAGPTRDICRMIESLITLLLRGSHESSTNQQAPAATGAVQALQWIRQMIDEEPSRSIRLDNIANAANVSVPSTCAACSARSAGMQPHESLPAAASATCGGGACCHGPICRSSKSAFAAGLPAWISVFALLFAGVRAIYPLAHALHRDQQHRSWHRR